MDKEIETTVVSRPAPEMLWLYSHCQALGMVKKSLSGKLEEDIALFVVDLKEAVRQQGQAKEAH